MEKFINKKTMPIIVICCAVLASAYEVLNLISNIKSSITALITIPAVLYWVAAMAIIAWGYYKEKENFIKLGIILSISFVASALPGAFNRVYTIFRYEYFSSSIDGFKNYGISVLCQGLADACIGVGFVLWVLKTFFNKETKPVIIDAMAIVAVVLCLASLVFLILSNSEFFKPGISEYFSIISDIAYIGIFVCELYRRKNA